MTRKWLKELDYRLIKELWAFQDNRIAVRFAYPSSVTLREGERYKPYQAINTSYTIRKKMVLYLLLEKNLAIASCAKALELRNGKCFRRVTEEGYEWHDDSGNWFRSYGNENWEFDEHGFMRSRIASINDLPIHQSECKYHWILGRRPDEHPGLSDLNL